MDDQNTDVENNYADKYLEIYKFLGYLAKIVDCLFEDVEIDNKINFYSKIQSILNESHNIEKIKKFVQDGQTPTLLIQKILNKDEEENINDAFEFQDNFNLIISNDIHYTSDKATSIALIKKGKAIEADKKICQQIRIINLSDDSPYETLRAYVSEAVAPYFKSYVRHSDTIDRESDKLAPQVEKKIAELEMGLLHLQQNIEIPEIILTVHPYVKQVLDVCQSEHRKPKIEDFDDKINDSAFLNSLQNQVNRWIREIQKVTKLEKDPASGGALQEITFWLNMEHALLKIQEKRDSLEVILSLDILKQGKRFHATVSFDTDTGLKQAIELVSNYNLLMRDFPINELLAAQDLNSIALALTQIFGHARKVRSTRYPVNRMLRLLEALSRDTNNQIKKVLSYKPNMLRLPFEEFEKVTLAASNVFTTWDDHYEKLLTLIREMNKKKGDPLKLIMRVNLIHKKLAHRMSILEKFRTQHEQLRTVISRVLRQRVLVGHQPASTGDDGQNPEKGSENNTEQHGGANQRLLDISDVTALKEISAAYEGVCESITEPLQVSKEADEAWDIAMKRYDERIDRIEARITAQLRDQLGMAKNANEMFRIFSRYNALFVRPRIRGAIREYQTQLIQHVKRDIERLKEKFKVPYNQTPACLLSEVRDIPPVSGHIIWVRQIERRLDMYTKRIEDILGKDWETHMEGRQLKSEAEAFRMKLLDSDSLFDEWASRVQSRNYTISGRIFNIEMVREYVNADGTSLRKAQQQQDTSLVSSANNNVSRGAGSFILDRDSGAESAGNTSDSTGLDNFAPGNNDDDYDEGDASLVFRYKLKVNFLPEIITLAKEVRNLKSLGYRISVAIMTNANKASQAYPLAISLMENVRAYEQSCQRLIGEPNLELLSAKLRKDVQIKISDGINLQWDSFKLEAYVPQFSDLIFYFQEKIDELTDLYEDIKGELGALESCPFNYQSFSEIMDAIQRAVDNLSLKQFSNLPCFIGRLDVEIRKRLGYRLYQGIQTWTHKLANLIDSTATTSLGNNSATGSTGTRFLSSNFPSTATIKPFKDDEYYDSDQDVNNYNDDDDDAKVGEDVAGATTLKKGLKNNVVPKLGTDVEGRSHKNKKNKDKKYARNVSRQHSSHPHHAHHKSASPGGDPKIYPLIHEFRISNQVMYLNPPIEEARERLVEQFFAWIGNVLSLTRITCSRYDLTPASTNYSSSTNLTTTTNTVLPGRGTTTGAGGGPKPDYRDLLATVDSWDVVSCSDNNNNHHHNNNNGDDDSSNNKHHQQQLPVLERCYELQSRLLSQVRAYVDGWFRYQSLWDLQPEKLYGKLGTEVPVWIACLIDIRRTRETFDTTDTSRKFGPIIVEFGKVQSKVSLKYDSWHKDVLVKFAHLLSLEMQTFYTAISKGRAELEQKNLDGATSTSQAVSLVTYVQTLKSRVKVWEKRVTDEFKEGQIVLEKHRFTLPNDWLHIEQVEGEWNAFHQILERKSAIIQNQVSHLQEKIIAEDTSVTKKCEDIIKEWEISKPVEGSTIPDTALKLLAKMESKFNELLKEKSNIFSAKEALGIVDNDSLSISCRDKTKFALEELRDLKSVWVELRKIWEELDALKDTPWTSLQPRKVRQSLDNLLGTLKTLPTNLRQYAAYDYVKKLIQSYSRANVLIVELKSDAIKDRHWKRLAKKFQHSFMKSSSSSSSSQHYHHYHQDSAASLTHKQSSPFESILTYGGLGNELTLGHVWDLDLVKNEREIKDIILIAQGEMALEQFLIQVRETWQNYELDMINYQNKCRIIRGWDDLFNKLKEHINSLAAMKLSPYFKEFEEEALAWEDKLTRINALFDVWIDVQRKWIYLETIFTGSNDIKNLLPNETSRFQSISSEFSNILKRVSKSPLVLDVLTIPGVQRSLERLSEFLCKIQKALGEYLERKRTSFPRFYFIGDEDLLEIIGNGKNIAKLQKHFKKMFAGIASITFEEDSSVLMTGDEWISSTTNNNNNQMTSSNLTSSISSFNDRGGSTEQQSNYASTSPPSKIKLTGFCSKEGENVTLARPITLDDNSLGKVNEWFAQLEREMKYTLAVLLAQSLNFVKEPTKNVNFYHQNPNAAAPPAADQVHDGFMEWIDKYQAQIIILTLQIWWTEKIEMTLNDSYTRSGQGASITTTTLDTILKSIDTTLSQLADYVLRNQPLLRRKKMEHMITELVHQRDVTRELVTYNVQSLDSFNWLKQMRFYFALPDPSSKDVSTESGGVSSDSLLTEGLRIEISTAKFKYGWEYLGVQEKLVQTPLTDQCFLAMTQALEIRLGGSPFGPAGTGKTESVKALGHILGRFVLVFNCDETFDFQAMGRIFVGLCQVGAWGCFDEFNRLEERILSAISQQIQTIQTALRESMTPNREKKGGNVIELVGKSVTINPNMAIFITMNPGYAGRSNLPDNLKKLFRSLAMTRPDVHLISQVLLFSQGFREAELLAKKVVPLFKLCSEQLSNQRHYDFGLRALKSVLTSAGNIKRQRIKCLQRSNDSSHPSQPTLQVDSAECEKEIIIQSVCETVIPKLVSEDIPLLHDLLADVFPAIFYKPVKTSDLRNEVIKVCRENYLVYDENSSTTTMKNSQHGTVTSNEIFDTNTRISKLNGDHQTPPVFDEGEEHYVVGRTWADKIIQLYHLTQIHHGIMLVGPSGSGKSTAWRTLFASLERLNKRHRHPPAHRSSPSSQSLPHKGKEDQSDVIVGGGGAVVSQIPPDQDEQESVYEEDGQFHVIDPKAVTKEALYGTLDPNTREWTDGLFTAILRKIIDNVRGEINRRQWIVFDGDVDPEWVENLNSVLDDNKLLTLPNGERLSIPSNVRILFEVQDLKYATLATVSRCGMIWFSEKVLSNDMVCKNYLEKLRTIPLMGLPTSFTLPFLSSTSTTTHHDKASRSSITESGFSDLTNSNIYPHSYGSTTGIEGGVNSFSGILASDLSESDLAEIATRVQGIVYKILIVYFAPNGMVFKTLEFAKHKVEHIMDFTRLRALNSLFSLLNQGVRSVINYQISHPDFPMTDETMERFIQCYLVYAIIWSFTGDSKLKSKEEMSNYIQSITTIPLPPTKPNLSIVDYELTILGEWVEWSRKVPSIDIETHKISEADCVIPTVDTARHESLLYTWLADHKPLILCGPPGSGKTMTLFNALRALSTDMEVVGLNFSSATTPELLLKTLDHYCEYRKTPNGTVLSPVQLNKWLVLFCDEINLPDMDKYGTQRVISFLRQILEHGGFYKSGEHIWVQFERIQFVGACNPPTDPGRKPLSHRLLRHVPVVYVDYPGPASLYQIYHTFNKSMLKLLPNLRSYSESLTNAMVEFYLSAQDNFTQDMQPHYIFSPRELTRWVRGMYEAIKPIELLDLDGLVRLWAHEGLRLFQDRLVNSSEREWTDGTLDNVAFKHFPAVDGREALKRPILYSNWLSKNYVPIGLEALREYTKARLKVFYEEELDVQLVLFDDVLDHVLRIDRVFRQPQGHVLLIGISGSGKTTMSRFVAWVNGLSIYQIKIHNKYTADNFDDDLRHLLKRAGCKGEKIAFIMDESNVLDSSFLERINTLLANGEVPGLFEGELYTSLMSQCKEGSQREGLMLDTNEELYKWFTNQVMRNLHVVFTMNPSSAGLKERSATSPALFNRCVINWFGDWSRQTLFQVGKELTIKLDLDDPEYEAPPDIPILTGGGNFGGVIDGGINYRDALINAFVYVHLTLLETNDKLAISNKGIVPVSRGDTSSQHSSPSSSSPSRTFITPRHFLDFITHYVKLYHEKRSDLEDEQLHLNVGLHKIRDTVEQVEELQKSLALKSRELETKNSLANAKLKEMIKDQQEAEMKKTTSQDIQVQLLEQEKLVDEKKQQAMVELAQVEPAVVDAQQAVKSIKKQPLVEVRSMANPPVAVKMALESICLLLGENYSDWKAIRSVLMKDNFIPMILNFNTDDISEPTRLKFISNYLNNPDYNYEKVLRASQACGPLVKWAIAQVNYADMLQKVEPLRNELRNLEKDAEENRLKVNKIDETIDALEKSIANYKEEYAVLISQAQNIKRDLEIVQTKVNRSVSLLENLSSERLRWEQGTKAFRTRLSTLPGDILLAAAFLAYAGYYDQSTRKCLVTKWNKHLTKSGVKYRSEIFGGSGATSTGGIAEYLCNPEDRARWLSSSTTPTHHSSGMEDTETHKSSIDMDDLYLENAVMIKRCITGNGISAGRATRYPLIIDPSGKALNFIANEYFSFNQQQQQTSPLSVTTPTTASNLNERKITKTSFLDDAFRKNLESALRFGNPLIVQDVENYDAILNPVLNREIRKTGGRVLITLGDQDIDLSPSFTIFMTTRDPTAEFSPDLCSRVCFINFTLTKSSLQSQCLNLILKAERPDIDAKRSDLYKIQGEFKLRLRHLEQNLLRVLNEAKGKSILEDDSVIATLENLKREASDITTKMEQTQTVLAEIEAASSVYTPFANACSTIYFTMEHLSKVNSLYQFSLPFFMNIIHTVLYDNPELKITKDHETRLSTIVRSLFHTVYERVCRALLHQDRLVFGVTLAKIYITGFLKSEGAAGNYDEEFDYLVHHRDNIIIDSTDTFVSELVNSGSLNTSRGKKLAQLTSLSAFKHLPKILSENNSETEVQSALKWLAGKDKHENYTDDSLEIPRLLLQNGSELTSNLGRTLRELILVFKFYPEYLSEYYHKLLDVVFENGFDDLADQELNLAKIIIKETNSRTHIMFCSVPGFDASSRIDDLSANLNKQLISIAIGSNEGFVNAEKAINQFSKTGHWVVLKNVHLAPHWLVQLEKKLHTMANPHPDFRLFMTMEINPKIPVTLLRSGEVLVFEPPPGLKANLTRTYNNFILSGVLSSPSDNNNNPNNASDRLTVKPMERSRVHFLLAWFHAVASERLSYTPLGWSKPYDFNEADLRCAFHTVDIWINSVASGGSSTPAINTANNGGGGLVLRNNVDPGKIPWNAIRVLLGKCDYGGKIDNDYDKLLLYAYLSKIFDGKTFEDHYVLVDRSKLYSGRGIHDINLNVTIPDGFNRPEQFYKWITDSSYFPSRTDPTWLGLPHNAETVIKIKMGLEVTRKLSELFAVLAEEVIYDSAGKDPNAHFHLEEEEEITTERGFENESLKKSTGISTWIKKLHDNVIVWLDLLRTIQEPPKIIPDETTRKNPLVQFLQREVRFGWKVLEDVWKDLTAISAVYLGQQKFTNHLRSVIHILERGRVPPTWFTFKTYGPINEVEINSWMLDYVKRLKRLIKYARRVFTMDTKFNTIDGNSTFNLFCDSKEPLWLGGLFNPEAFITATRQFTARQESLSLEDLKMEMTIHESFDITALHTNFIISGMKLQGAKSVNNILQLVTDLSNDLPLISLKWVKNNAEQENFENKLDIETLSTQNEMYIVKLPVYLNQTRSDLLFDITMKTKAPEHEPNLFYERGVAFIC